MNRPPPLPSERASGPAVLRTRRGRAFAQRLVFALLWCAVAAVHAAVIVRGPTPPAARGGAFGPRFAIALVALFALAGVWMLVRAVALGLRLAAPHVEITCSRGIVARGVSTTFSYRLAGRPEDFSCLRVWLVGVRRRTVRHGRDVRVEAREFSRTELLRAATPHEIGQGFFDACPDPDAPPSGGRRERILWFLDVAGERPGRLAIRDHYSVTVA